MTAVAPLGSKSTAKVIWAAWAVYTASWFIQVIKGGTTLSQGGLPGWEAFLVALGWGASSDLSLSSFGRIISMLSALTNLLMIASPLVLISGLEKLRRALPWLFVVAAILNAWWLQAGGDLRAGYYLWFGSFCVLAVCLQRSR